MVLKAVQNQCPREAIPVCVGARVPAIDLGQLVLVVSPKNRCIDFLSVSMFDVLNDRASVKSNAVCVMRRYILLATLNARERSMAVVSFGLPRVLASCPSSELLSSILGSRRRVRTVAA